jgi:hypothetical protein
VKLVHNHPLRTVHHVLATAHHHRHLPEVDLLLRHLGHVLPNQANHHAERPTVRQPKLPALICVVPRLVQLVVQILKLHAPVVRFDREYLAQQRFEPDLGVALVVIVLQL